VEQGRPQVAMAKRRYRFGMEYLLRYMELLNKTYVPLGYKWVLIEELENKKEGKSE
jgi:hypothetical protein